MYDAVQDYINITTSGTYTSLYVPTLSKIVFFARVGCDFTITNISVREVYQNYNTSNTSYDFNTANKFGVRYESEYITAQNNRDFSSGTIGNWIKTGDGNGTITYDGTNPAGEKVGKITIGATAGTYYYATLSDAYLTTMTAGKTYKIQARYYIEAGASFTSVRIRCTEDPAYSVLSENYSTETKGRWFTVTLDRTTVNRLFRIDVVTLGGATGDILYFDDATIKEIVSYQNHNPIKNNYDYNPE